jgi:hypothetical protein
MEFISEDMEILNSIIYVVEILHIFVRIYIGG